jgi:predicted ATPase
MPFWASLNPLPLAHALLLTIGTGRCPHFASFMTVTTKAALERARLLIERATAQGKPPEDPLLLFSVLYGFWAANYTAFDGKAVRELARQFLSLAEKQGATAALVAAHRLMGTSLVHTGDIAEGRAHYDQAIALYDPAAHGPMAMRFGQDLRVVTLSQRSIALWFLGYPKAALADTERALESARALDQSAHLMYALLVAAMIRTFCGDNVAAHALLGQLYVLADETGSSYWKAFGTAVEGCGLVLTSASDAVQIIISGLAAWRSTGATLFLPWYLSSLAIAYANVGRLQDARRSVAEVITVVQTTSETLWQAEVDRIAGEIALKSPEPDAAKAQEHFERALAVARQQQAKSWELRAAMSLGRL